jgi:hypothetical protein
MNIYDIRPCETFWEIIEQNAVGDTDQKVWFKQELIDDIREHGLKYALNVDEYGIICNGNCRYWAARYLLEEEDDQRFQYLPVQKHFAVGLFYRLLSIVLKGDPDVLDQPEIADHMLAIRTDLSKKIMNIKDKVIPSNTTWPHIEVDPEDEMFTMEHWDHNVHEYTSYLERHPDKPNMWSFFMIHEKSSSAEDSIERDSKKKLVEDVKVKREEHKSKMKNLRKKYANHPKQKALRRSRQKK